MKQTVVGIGSADKVQVQEMVSRILQLSAKPQADAADALAIAITHAHSIQHSLVVSRQHHGEAKSDKEQVLALMKTRYSRGRFRLKG